MNASPGVGVPVRSVAADLAPLSLPELQMDPPPAAEGVAVFIGRFGSGKTETAINYALLTASHLERAVQAPPGELGSAWASERRRSPSVFLIDLDIVTPYFRSRELAVAMEEAGVAVISPAREGQYLDVPAISPEILGTIQQSELPVVIDVGGDRQGARALGQFSAAIARHQLASSVRVNFVVNPYRPFTGTLDGLAASISEIEASSRLAVTGLVSNPNLMGDTTVEVILEGHAKVEFFSQALGVPIAFICVERSLALRAESNGRPSAATRAPSLSQLRQPILILHRYFSMSWERVEVGGG